MAIEKSGFYYPNKFVRLYLEGVEELLGHEGLVKLMTIAGLPQFAKMKLPDNLELSVDFAYFTAIQEAFEQLYGRPIGDDMARESGRRVFTKGLSTFAPRVDATDLAHTALSVPEKLKIGLPAMASVMMQFSDQISQAYQWEENHYIYTLERCPMCWKRQADRPVCFAGQGLLEAAADWAIGEDQCEVTMTACVAKGDEMGRYEIRIRP